MKLGLEAQCAIALRWAKILRVARLLPRRRDEMSEKLLAFGEASAMLLWGAAPKKIVRRYRRHVKTNRRRLRAPRRQISRQDQAEADERAQVDGVRGLCSCLGPGIQNQCGLCRALFAHGIFELAINKRERGGSRTKTCVSLIWAFRSPCFVKEKTRGWSQLEESCFVCDRSVGVVDFRALRFLQAPFRLA